MRVVLKLFSVSFLLFLAACSKHIVASDVEASVQANKNSESMLDWEASAAHPNVLISKWAMQEARPEDICDALMSRTDDELALFEDQIQTEEFAAKIYLCVDKLQLRISQYWSNQESLVRVTSTSSTRFQNKVIYRDLSNGYYVVHADLAPKQVMLTFDDGPHALLTDSILKTMESYNAKATFFTLGRSVKANPSVLKRVAAAGHSIGSHTVSHPCLAQRSACRSSNGGKLYSFAEATKQIVGGHKAIFDVLGWADPFFRFPYGEASPELKKYLRDRSVAEFFWSVDSEDWKAKTPDQLISGVMSQLNRQGRGVILFHDIQKRTAIAMPRLLQRLLESGYTTVLMKSSNPQPPGSKLLQ